MCHNNSSHSFVKLHFLCCSSEKQIMKKFSVDSCDGLNLLAIAEKYSDQVFFLKKGKNNLVFEIQFPLFIRTPVCSSSASQASSVLLNNKISPLKSTGMLSPNRSRAGLAM